VLEEQETHAQGLLGIQSLSREEQESLPQELQQQAMHRSQTLDSQFSQRSTSNSRLDSTRPKQERAGL